ncbi:MAG: hypothetical protein LBR36_07645, partial [Bacteroidales bacterium]|nr:hypothetical protein [Bacteroidales bacterium]
NIGTNNKTNNNNVNNNKNNIENEQRQEGRQEGSNISGSSNVLVRDEFSALLPSEGRPTEGLSDLRRTDNLRGGERISKTYNRPYSGLTLQEKLESLIPSEATPLLKEHEELTKVNYSAFMSNANLVASFSLHGWGYAFYSNGTQLIAISSNLKNIPNRGTDATMIFYHQNEDGIFEVKGELYGVSKSEVKEITQTINRFLPQGTTIYETVNISYDGLRFLLSQLKHGYKMGRVYNKTVPISVASNFPSLPNFAQVGEYTAASVDKATAEVMKADIDKLLKPYGMEATIREYGHDSYSVAIPQFTVVAQNDSYEDRIDKIEHPEAYTDASAENTQTDTQSDTQSEMPRFSISPATLLIKNEKCRYIFFCILG